MNMFDARVKTQGHIPASVQCLQAKRVIPVELSAGEEKKNASTGRSFISGLKFPLQSTCSDVCNLHPGSTFLPHSHCCRRNQSGWVQKNKVSPCEENVLCQFVPQRRGIGLVACSNPTILG